MIDHVVLNVKDLETSRAFYLRSLAPLGYEIVKEYPEGIGFGVQGKPDFWITSRKPAYSGVHVAFTAPNQETVQQFHQAALAAGGTDNGAPGLRPDYHPGYYGGFVLDPDGNNIEAVFVQL